MAQNSEQIESKLCAYIEGELDERGRAEIEKHLQANPHHRKLLAELGETRRMMQALPRESAPPELFEAFQSQLERSVLLDYTDGRDEPAAYRINRFPQFFAAAAIVMLAVGLGLIVYFALPITPSRTEVVSDTPSLSTAPVLDDRAAAVPPWTPDERDPRRRRGSDAAREAEALAAGTAGAAAPPPPSSDTAGGIAAPLSAKTVTPAPAATLPADAPRLPVVAEQLRSVADGGRPDGGLFVPAPATFDRSVPEPVVVVVSDPDPAAADGILRRALARIPDATWADATAVGRPPALPPDAAAAAATAESQEQKSETTALAAATTEPERAVTQRMLRQASDVLLRRTAGRTDLTDVPAPADETSLAHKSSAPDDAPAERKPSDLAVGGAGSVPGRLVPTRDPAASQPLAGATAPTGIDPKSDAAKRDKWALNGAGKESPSLVVKGQADEQAKPLNVSVDLPSAPDSEPAHVTTRGTQADGAAEDATLSTAYRVIVAQNVPRSQVEALRRELGDGTADQRKVAVYGVQFDSLKDAVAAADNGPSTAAGAAGRGGGAGLEKTPAEAVGEGLKQASEPTTEVAAAAGQKHESKKMAEPTGPGAARPAVPGAPALAEAATKAAQLDPSKDRTVRVGDTLRVSVLPTEPGKPPVEQDVRIADDGTLTLAQADEAVYSDGLTVAELERHLETTLARDKSPAATAAATAPAPRGARNMQPTVRVASPRVTIATVAIPSTPTQVAQMPAQPAEPDTKAADAAQRAAKPDAHPAATLPPELTVVPVETVPARGPTATAPVAAAPAAEPRVEVVFVVRQTSPAVAEPAAESAAIENSEILTVTVEDPKNPSTTNVRVAEDGTVDVPLAGKVKAAGKTTTQLESDIETRWRDGKATVAPGTKAKVARPTDAPAAATSPALDAPAAKQ